MKACLIMYKSEADEEVFSVLRTCTFVQHYIKWNNVKGTGSGGLSVIGTLDESQYSVVLVALPDDKASVLAEEIKTLRENMLHKTGIATLILQADSIV